MPDHHLAEINIGRLNAPIDSPIIADFVNALERINRLADTTEGFVWRLQTEDGNATSIRPFEDDLMIINLSTWESFESLADYVYRSAHAPFLRRRREWFERPTENTMALWWVPVGKRPRVDEAIARLEHLRRHGPTPHAFTFRTRFAPGSSLPAPTEDRDTCRA